MTLRDVITDALDVLALLAVAAGCGFAAGLLIGWSALVVVGAIIFVGVRVMDWLADPPRAPRWWQARVKGGRT